MTRSKPIMAVCAARAILAVTALAGVWPTAAAWAETMQTSPALRQAAITSCTGDVLRLCTSVMFDEQKIFACMKANRAQLSPSCRAVFDEGAKTVRR